MQFARVLNLRVTSQTGEIQAEANLNVLLRQIVSVNQHLADLVGSVGVFALLGVVILEQELAVGVFIGSLALTLERNVVIERCRLSRRGSCSGKTELP